MIFNFIDKLTAFESGKYAIGSKTVSENQRAYLVQGKMPPMYLVEAIGQLNAWITMEMNGFKVRPIAILYNEINLYDTASVGDALIIESHLSRVDESTSLFNGTVKCNNQILVEVIDAAGSFLNIDEFACDAEYKSQFNTLKTGELRDADNIEPISNLLNQDAILEHTATKIIAHKTIEENYPLFKEHFPRKPVLPISILLQNNIELAKQHIGVSCRLNFKNIQFQKIKMRDFIVPGALLSTEINLSMKDEFYISYKVDNKVDEKIICRSNINFFL